MPKLTLRSLIFALLSICSLTVNGQVVASFTTDDTAGCAPLVVHYTNTSSGATSYTWNLGVGGTLTGTDESIAYTAVGTYTVTLTASNGTTSSTSTTIIRVYANPTVSFHASDTSVCPGTPVTFTSTSTSGAWGGITYTWNFGDGGSSTASAPVHTYPTPGFYNVTLYATNVKGCVGSHAQPAYMHVFTPAAVSFHSATLFCKPPATITLTNTTTGTGAFTYTWKYGDGGTSGTASPVHTYTAPGNYTVSLKVTDGNGCIDSLVQPAYVNVGSLAAAFTSSPTTACIGFPITFTNTSTSYISSNWSFGDGGTSTVVSPVHSYTAAGTYTVRLIAYNGGTCYDTVTHTVTVAASPTGGFTISPLQPCPPPASITLTGTASPGSTVSWIFGDSTLGSGTTVTHVFHLSKVYFINMIITNGSGCKDTVQKSDTLYNLNVNASTTSPLSGCAPLAVNFSSYDFSVVTDSLYTTPLYLTYPYTLTGYSWNFGDGSPTSTLPTPVHSYTAAGSYNATVTVTTSNGCTASANVTINVGTPPHASFTGGPRHVCTDRTSTYTSTSTGAIDYYLWNFGDGGVVSGGGLSSVTHIDSVPGIHSVSLVAYDNFCPSAPFSLTDTVDSPKAIINFTYTCIPKNGISFTDASLGDNSHTWIFGDGATSTIGNPVHFYPALTTYTIKLATFNTASGCRDTASAAGLLSGPFVSFMSDSINICRDKLDTFISTVIGSSPVLNYRWYDNGVAEDSTDANFMYYFHVRGLHTISLVIKDNRNCLDTFTRTNYVNVAKPIDNYSFTPTSGCASLAVHFTDLSTDVPGAPLKRYFWSFGDGDTTTVTLPNIVHTYTASGTFTVQEIVTDTIGCKDTLVTSTLSVNRPHATFLTASTNVCANSAVHFTNGSTGYSSVFWTFGDGYSSSIVSPDHVYTTPGVYTVRLIVYSSTSCADTMTVASYITVNPSPTASFDMNDSFAICPPLNVTFTNTSTGALFSSWNLGDGTFSTTTSPGDIYVSSGIDTVTLVATNSYGCTDTAVRHATIFGYAGAFSYTPVSGCSPLSVHFSTTPVSASNIIWDFNDGTTALSVGDTITHTYRGAGAYVPKLILTDTTGCTSFSLGADTIKVDTIIPSFTFVPTSACQNSPITFTDHSTSYFSSITGRSWTFLAGVTSGSISPVYTYSLSGTYPVTLRILDGMGCSSTLVQNVTVTPPPPAITGTTSLCAGSTGSLSDLSSGTWSVSGTSIATINSSTGVVTGVAPGTATVTFTSTAGCAVTTPVTIHPSPGPIAGVSSICTGSTATFSDTTAGGAWSSSSTSVATVGTSGIVTGVTGGTAIITYSFGGSCIVTKIVTVSPSPTSISGASTVCVGVTTAEVDGVTGGTWVSSNLSVATIGTDGTVTGVAPGTTTITYSPGAGCFTVKTMTVNSSPSGITGTMTVCQGSATHLADVTSSGIWSSSPMSVGTVTSAGVVSGVSPGVDTISYTLAGCPAIALVTVYPTPAIITGSASICAGSSTTLFDAASGGTWSSSNTAVATAGTSSGIIAGVSPAISIGTSTITYSLGGGCIATKVVTVNPIAPITGITALCAGLTSTLSDAVSGGTWGSSSTSVASIGLSTGHLTTSTSGNTTITYALPSGCVATTIVTVNLAPSTISGSPNVCVGAFSGLTDGGGGTWTSGNTSVATVGSTSGILGGVTTGTSSITYSLGSGCAVTTVITVNPSPLSPTGPSSVCAGGISITLTDGTTGGSWFDGGPASIATVTNTTGIVSGVTTGTAIITYTVASTGCSAYKTITINPSPDPITGTTFLCAGTRTTLHETSTGGTWHSTSTAIASIDSVTGTVTGVSSGIIDVYYVFSTGCARNTTIDVTAIPTPISGSSDVCIGGTGTLTDSVSGGTWSSSAATSAIATIDPASGLVHGLSLGTAIITYSLGGTCITHKTVTVDPLPLSITGATTVCTGTNINLTDATTGGTWSSGNTAVATVDTFSGMVGGVSPGTASIVYTSSAGCTTAITVTVIAGIPLIVGTTHVCAGFTTLLTDIASGGTWISSNTDVATVAGGVVSGITAGTTMISYTTSGCPATAIVTVNPLPGPIVGGPHICIRLATPFTDSSSGGIWTTTTPATATAGPGSGLITGLRTGSAMIVYTLPTGCSTSTTVIIDTVPPGIMGINHICVGQTTLLTDTATGGVWSSNGPSSATVVPTGTETAVVTGLSAGVVAISYTISGCPAIANVIVNPVPGPILGLRNICAYGSTNRVRDTTAGGTWTSILATVSDSGVITSFAAGTAMITYTLATGCKVVDSFTVYPLPGPISGSSHLCIGLTTSLSDTSIGGIWGSTDHSVATIGAGSGIVNSVSPGLTTITFLVPATGCTDSIHLTVYPHPSLIYGTPTVCIGATTTLIDSIAGGSWTSSGTSRATVDASLGSVTGISEGTSVITYTLAPSCFSARLVTVIPLPAVHSVTGGGNYCVGSSGVHIGLDGSDPGINYHMYLGGVLADTAAGTGFSIDFGLQTDTGTYTIVAVNATTACAQNMLGSAHITLTDVVIPTVSIFPGPTYTVCAGTPVGFRATATNEGSAPLYQWSVNGGAAGADTPYYSYVPTDHDLVRVMLVSSATCAIPDTVYGTVAMTVITPLPFSANVAADPGAAISAGENVSFTANVINGSSSLTYQWIVNGTPVPGATTASYENNNFANGDSVSCVVISAGLCDQVASGWVIVTISNVGIKPISTEGGLTVMPNPANGEFVIKGLLGTLNDEEVTIELTDMLGQVVYNGKVMTYGGKINERILLSRTVANGMYMLNLKSGVGNQVFHLVVEQ